MTSQSEKLVNIPRLVEETAKTARNQVSFCRLPITFANSLDPNQDRQNVGPDLDPNCLTL